MTLSRPEQLAEAKPIPEHERLAQVFRDLAVIVENSAVAVIAKDGVFEAAQSLHYWLAAMVPAAERQREIDGKPVERPSVVLLDDPPEG